MMLAQYVSKCIHHPQKNTFKHQSVNIVIKLFLVIELIELQFLCVF